MNRFFCLARNTAKASDHLHRFLSPVVLIDSDIGRSLEMCCHRHNSSVITRQEAVKEPKLCKPKTVSPEMISFSLNNLESMTGTKSRWNHCKSLMCGTFHLTDSEAECMLKDNPLLWKEFLEETFEYTKSLGLTKATFMHHSWMLTVSPETIYRKLSLIAQVFPDLGDINTSAELMKLPLEPEDLTTMLKHWATECEGSSYASKFHFLSQVLKIPLGQVIQEIGSKSFLIAFPFAKLRRSVELCLNAGMSETDLAKDLWFVRYRESSLQKRVEILRQANSPIKPWMIRAKKENFEAYLLQYQEQQSCPQTVSDLKNYIMQRLQCDSSTAADLASMKPFSNFKKAGAMKKLIQKMDYLLIEKGVDPQLIVSNPRLLTLSFATIQRRVEILLSSGMDLNNFLWVVCKTPIRFESFLKQQKMLDLPSKT